MSNFTKEELYRLYDIFLPHFTTLAEEANAHGIHLHVDISPEGRIEFTSREYTQNDKGEDVVRKHYIKQTPKSVADGSETYKL